MFSLTSIQAMSDELTKIADVSITGLSPQALLESPQRMPMETDGFSKARQILARAEMSKTASKEKIALLGIGAEVASRGRFGLNVGFPYIVSGNYRFGDDKDEWAPTVGLGLTGPHIGVSYRGKKKGSQEPKKKTAARKPNKEDYSKTRRYVAPTAAGAATGALLGSLTNLHAPVQKHRMIGAGVGAGTALVDAVIRHHKKKELSHGKG